MLEERDNKVICKEAACSSRTTVSTNVDVVKTVALKVVGAGVTVVTGVRVERTEGWKVNCNA